MEALDFLVENLKLAGQQVAEKEQILKSLDADIKSRSAERERLKLENSALIARIAEENKRIEENKKIRDVAIANQNEGISKKLAYIQEREKALDAKEERIDNKIEKLNKQKEELGEEVRRIKESSLSKSEIIKKLIAEFK